MITSNFNEANISFGPPEGVSEDDCRTIRAWKGSYPNGQPVVITCWKPTQEEMEMIQETGRVWLHMLGSGMPPVILEAKFPFDKQ